MGGGNLFSPAPNQATPVAPQVQAKEHYDELVAWGAAAVLGPTSQRALALAIHIPVTSYTKRSKLVKYKVGYPFSNPRVQTNAARQSQMPT